MFPPRLPTCASLVRAAALPAASLGALLGFALAACTPTTTPRMAPTSGQRSDRAPVVCRDAPVTLRLAWPEVVAARVASLDLTESANDDGTRPMRGESVSALLFEIGPHRLGRVARFVVAGRSRSRSQGFGPDMGDVRPAVVIGAGGEIVDVEGAEAMSASLERLRASGNIPDDTAASIAPNLTHDAQLAIAHAHWAWIGKLWDGRTMACGAEVRLRGAIPTAVFGPTTTRANIVLRYLGHAPCFEGAPTSACVKLEATATVKHSELLGGLTRAGMNDVVDGSIVRTVELVVAPDTLLPHRVAFLEVSALVRDHRPGGTRNIRDVQEYVFRYLDTVGERLAFISSSRYLMTVDGEVPTLPYVASCARFLACCTSAAMESNPLACMPFTGLASGEDCSQSMAAITRQYEGLPPVCRP